MAQPLVQATTATSTEEDNRRYCWVCYASDEDDETASWVKPCQCRGTTKWVHQSCLQRWVDEKQKGNSTVKVNCPQCGMQYMVSFPDMGQLMLFLDRMDAFIYKVCPFVAAGVVVGSCYWVAVTYGAITVMQVVGFQEGMFLMETADPLVLLVGLPIIPVFLILGKMVRWEDKMLRFLRSSVRKLPFLKYILPGFRCDESDERGGPASTTAVISDPINATRVLCGALSLPTLATLAGRAFYPACTNTLTQTMMGGISFLIVKGLFKVYYKQQQHVMQSKRIIKDYPHHVENQPYTTTASSSTTTSTTTTASSTTSPTNTASSALSTTTTTTTTTNTTNTASSTLSTPTSTTTAASSSAVVGAASATATSSAVTSTSSSSATALTVQSSTVVENLSMLGNCLDNTSSCSADAPSIGCIDQVHESVESANTNGQTSSIATGTAAKVAVEQPSSDSDSDVFECSLVTTNQGESSHLNALEGNRHT